MNCWELHWVVSTKIRFQRDAVRDEPQRGPWKKASGSWAWENRAHPLQGNVFLHFPTIPAWRYPLVLVALVSKMVVCRQTSSTAVCCVSPIKQATVYLGMWMAWPLLVYHGCTKVTKMKNFMFLTQLPGNLLKGWFYSKVKIAKTLESAKFPNAASENVVLQRAPCVCSSRNEMFNNLIGESGPWNCHLLDLPQAPCLLYQMKCSMNNLIGESGQWNCHLLDLPHAPHLLYQMKCSTNNLIGESGQWNCHLLNLPHAPHLLYYMKFSTNNLLVNLVSWIHIWYPPQFWSTEHITGTIDDIAVALALIVHQFNNHE